jgi:hypothetical protein
MFENKTRVLLILSQEVLDQARVLAGKTTTALKLPVSLQIVLRALLEVGLKRENHSALLVNIEGQARRYASGGAYDVEQGMEGSWSVHSEAPRAG